MLIGYGLTTAELSEIDGIYKTFPLHFAQYATLMAESDEKGQMRSYLASEEKFQIVQEMQKKNLIVPVVGDFAGKKTLKTIGNYLKEHDATVSAFYTSNVEPILFAKGEEWRQFYSNVAELPLDSQSTFIRAVYLNKRFVSQASSMSNLIEAIRNDSIQTFDQAIKLQ
jgi:hypothetical protein